MAASEPVPFPRLLAVNLSSLSDDEMTALRMECLRLNCSFEELLTSIVTETATRLIPQHESQD